MREEKSLDRVPRDVDGWNRLVEFEMDNGAKEINTRVIVLCEKDGCIFILRLVVLDGIVEEREGEVRMV